MKLPFYDAMSIGIDARAKLFTAYLYISMFVLMGFSALFFIYGFYTAALIQLVMVFSFVLSFVMAVKKYGSAAKILAISASIATILIQTNYVFSPEAGFQYMLFPLLVIVFLFNDLSVSSDRLLTIFYTVIITIAFFISSHYQFSGPMILLSDVAQSMFHNASLFTSFTALAILLYLYSLQLSHKEATLSFLAEYDALTQIYNRGYFTTNGHKKFQVYKDKKQTLSAIIMDIDDFKMINDTYGHHVGDVVLQELARTVKSHLREETIFSRYGGEEFAILMENMPLTTSYKLAERLRIEIEEMKIIHHDIEIKFTVSIGVSTLLDSHMTFEDIMKDADRALYISKSKGKNKTWVINDTKVAFQTIG